MANSTVGEVARLLNRSEKKIRKIVDSLGDVEYFGGKRVVSATMLPSIIEELNRRENRTVEHGAVA